MSNKSENTSIVTTYFCNSNQSLSYNSDLLETDIIQYSICSMSLFHLKLHFFRIIQINYISRTVIESICGQHVLP